MAFASGSNIATKQKLRPKGSATKSQAMNNRHAPGPWRIADGVLGQDNPVLVMGADGLPVAATFCAAWLKKYNLRADGGDGLRANAQLIAAAPEMLDALRFICSEIGSDGPEVLRKWKACAEAAIRKATN